MGSSSSVGSWRQRARAASQAAPFGACGRPARYSKVVSSGAIKPARAPPSIDMLHTVMRSSMESPPMALPVNSNTEPVPPATPMLAISARIMSLAATPGRSLPFTSTRKLFDGRCSRHCVASTFSTSLVPMPKASAPNAPCVAVWLSPQTTVMPGCVSPSSGPITCTMPWRSLCTPRQRMPNSAQLVSSWASCRAAISSTMGSDRSVVGMLWSAVAMVRSGRRTLRPRSRSPWKACGEVTSCTRCRSMKSRVGAPACRCTTWASQTFSMMVRGIAFLRPECSNSVLQHVAVGQTIALCGLSLFPGQVRNPVGSRACPNWRLSGDR